LTPAAARCHTPRRSGTSSGKGSSPTRPAWTSSASASTLRGALRREDQPVRRVAQGGPVTWSGQTRGFAVPTEDSFRHEVGPDGALYVGSPETVAQKIAANLTTLGATRFDLKYGMGGLAHHDLMTNIELYGTQVIPRVRELLA
jgi:alkanesulfonate monooxygenase SsuD/methylene tetrahydromethanopterin reductase-like flavin-dependent oxidoreductase (luciferase family)